MCKSLQRENKDKREQMYLGGSRYAEGVRVMPGCTIWELERCHEADQMMDARS